MRVYLIDYENVSYSGIKGIEKLDKNDRVCIFYNELIKTIPIDTGIELAGAEAEIGFFKTKKTGKNYLDFQVSTLLGYIVGVEEKAEIYIVSKDTGFDSVIDFWEDRDVLVRRIENIAESFEKEKASEKEKPKPSVSKESEPAKKKTSVSTKVFSEEYRKKVRAAVKKENIPPNGYTIIYKAIIESSDKKELHNAMVKAFNNKGPAIYKLVKNIYGEYIQDESK